MREYETVEAMMVGEGFGVIIADSRDPRTIPEQVREYYAHGGGWGPLTGWTIVDPTGGVVKYPGDPKKYPDARAPHRGEMVYWYRQGSWLGLLDADDQFHMNRVD